MKPVQTKITLCRRPRDCYYLDGRSRHKAGSAHCAKKYLHISRRSSGEGGGGIRVVWIGTRTKFVELPPAPSSPRRNMAPDEARLPASYVEYQQPLRLPSTGRQIDTQNFAPSSDHRKTKRHQILSGIRSTSTTNPLARKIL